MVGMQIKYQNNLATWPRLAEHKMKIRGWNEKGGRLLIYLFPKVPEASPPPNYW